jgi:hypothetical protein
VGSAAIAARTRSAICAASAASCGPGPAAQVQPDPDEPRPEALGIAQAVEPDEGGHDRLLRRVCGQLALAGRPAASGEQDAVVALDEDRERATIAAAGGGHKVRIGSVATGHEGCIQLVRPRAVRVTLRPDAHVMPPCVPSLDDG